MLAAVVAVGGYKVSGREDPPGEPRPAPVAGDVASPWEEEPLVRLAVAGDTGTGDDDQRNTVAAMERAAASDPFDAILLLGDLIYDDGGRPELVEEVVIEPFEPLTSAGAEIVPVLGDHEVQAGYGDDITERFGLRTTYYAKRMGPLRIVVLDTNKLDEDQHEWLQKTLSQSPRGVRWTIVALHRPPYSAGHSGSSIDVQEEWSPLFERYDVPLVLAGHNHDYERSRPVNGVTYVVSGAGAKRQPVGSDEFTEVSAAVRHFLDVAVYDDRLEVQAVDQDDELVDRFVLE